VPKFDYDIDRRRAAGRFAPYLDPLMEQLRGSGYGPDSRVTYRAGFVHLAAWCQRQRIRPRELTDDVVDRFARHARGCKCRPLGIGRPRRGPRSQDHARAARRVLQFLRSIGIARPRRRPRTTQLVAGYACWLRERGLAVSTSRHRLRWSGLLMESLGSDPGQYRPADVRHFITVQCRARRYKIATSQSVVAAVRAFLTYLVVVGRCDHSVLDALPRLAHWRRSSHPRYLSALQVERTIATPRVATPVGLRDRAALLLLARLGVRAGEVMRLTLADVDWGNRRIRIISSKTREPAWLPLPRDVAQALRVHIRKGRPVTSDQHVFVRAKAPLVGGGRPSMIGHLVVKALQRAGVDAPIRGPHVFRHSLATALLRNGWSLEAIGALLRHRHPESTAIYAKVDFKALRLVVQPWPDARKS
jgi:site-specific recombinase XerD